MTSDTISEPNEGQVLAGRYELQESIGRGGFGVVWRATERSSGRTVALKHPNYWGRAPKDLVDKYFKRETDVLAEIDDAGGHPNIVGYYGNEHGFGMPFIVLELITGDEIGEVVRGDDPLTDPEAVREVGIGVCDALSFLHDNDIIYRDLKPDNIMLEADQTPKIIDFTTAKGFVPEKGAPAFATGDGENTDDSTVPGEFKPPELNKGAKQRQGPWSDVYSVGKILCFLLVGWVPDDDGVRPSEFGIESAPYLDDIVETATLHDCGDRYPNASALRTALENRDPALPEQASIVWLGRDQEWTISPGDTIGRATADGPSPSVVLDDDRQKALSAVHCRFDADNAGNWRLIDTSLNGTYVSKRNERTWELLLSERGQRRQRESGSDVPANPPSEIRLEDGDTVALVDPQYPERFYFQFRGGQ